jgi:hypothetical protein
MHRPSDIRTNRPDLVIQTVSGQIAHPVGGPSPWRIGNDGRLRVLPATGGITINKRIGDRCVGLAADHVEPGVSLHNNGREVIGPRNGPNMALVTYACVGNRAKVTSGPAAGAMGLVTGKHGGVYHVMVDFPTEVLCKLRIGDHIQIYSYGLGLALPDYPGIAVTNCAPGLLRRWGIVDRNGTLDVPVTHCVPAGIIGSGLGKNTVWRGDFDIQLFDPAVRAKFGLGSLRFGDLVAVIDQDARFGPAYRAGRTTIGVVVHSDSTVSGHGPGITALLTGPRSLLRPVKNRAANLAGLYGLRALEPTRSYRPLAGRKPVLPPLDTARTALAVNAFT